MHAFISRPELPDHSESFVADQLQAITCRIDALAYYRARHHGSTMRNLLCEVMSDHAYCGPSNELAINLSVQGTRVFGNVFEGSPPASRYKACHCIGLPFVFGNAKMWGDAGMLAGASAAEMAALSATVPRAWITFVHQGAPEPDPMIRWPRFLPDDQQVMRLWRRIETGISDFTR
jgi:carboxylesterase type B